MTTITESNITQQLDLSQFQIILPEDSIKQLVIYPSRSDFPVTGKVARIYHTLDTRLQWLWDDAIADYHLMLETIDCGEF
jgi:hypothetical protein